MARPRATSEEGKQLLAQIRSIKPFLIASLTTTTTKCSNPTCRCATEGPCHQVTLLTWKEHQTTKTLSVPRHLVEEVRQWVTEGRRLKELLTQMSEAQRAFLRTKKKPANRS